jgi:hypothetical protein
MPLDRSKLHKVVITSDGFQAQCPECARNGHDSTGNHLRVWGTGKWSCVLYPSDESHNRAIWELAGDESSEPAFDAVQLPTLELDRVWDVSLLDGLVKDYSYWEGRGISRETIEPFRGGVATKGQLDGRWVIPIFNYQNDEQIIGFTGRALKPGMLPKYKHLGKVSRWVWGGLEDIQSSRRAILVESPADVLFLREHGVYDVICLFGVNLSQNVLGFLIAADPEQIIVSTNNDSKHRVGQMAAEKIKKSLDLFFSPETIEIILPPAKDWADSLPERIRDTFHQ